jgi:hypothetical protein
MEILLNVSSMELEVTVLVLLTTPVVAKYEVHLPCWVGHHHVGRQYCSGVHHSRFAVWHSVGTYWSMDLKRLCSLQKNGLEIMSHTSR